MHTIGIVPCNDNLMIEFAQLMGLQETVIFKSYSQWEEIYQIDEKLQTKV